MNHFYRCFVLFIVLAILVFQWNYFLYDSSTVSYKCTEDCKFRVNRNYVSTTFTEPVSISIQSSKYFDDVSKLYIPMSNASVFDPKLCGNVYTYISKRACHLYNFLIIRESVEVQLVRAFSPILDSLCVDYYDISRRGGVGAQYATAFIDIGVNDGNDVVYWHKRFGTYPSPCASSYNTEKYNIARFFLFEPQQNYSQMIRKYLEGRLIANKNVNDTVFFPAAIGSNNQHRQFMNLIGTGQQGSVIDGSSAPSSKGAAEALMKLKNSGTVTVMMLSLEKVLWESLPLSYRGSDDIVNISLLPPVMFMKVDCEGADATILKEAKNLLMHHKIDLIMFEMNLMVGNFAVKYGDAAEVMEKAGYRLYLIGIWRGGAVKANHPEHRKATGRAVNYAALEINSAFLGAVEPSLETVIAISPKLVRKMEEMANNNPKQMHQWNKAAHVAALKEKKRTGVIEKVIQFGKYNWSSYEYHNHFWAAIGGKPLPKKGLWKSDCFIGRVMF